MQKKNKCPPWIYRNTFLYICHSPWIKYLFPYYFEGLIILANNHILKYQELKQKQQKVVYFPYNFPLRIWECNSVIEHLPRISVALGSRSRTEKNSPKFMSVLNFLKPCKAAVAKWFLFCVPSPRLGNFPWITGSPSLNMTFTSLDVTISLDKHKHLFLTWF